MGAHASVQQNLKLQKDHATQRSRPSQNANNNSHLVTIPTTNQEYLQWNRNLQEYLHKMNLKGKYSSSDFFWLPLIHNFTTFDGSSGSRPGEKGIAVFQFEREMRILKDTIRGLSRGNDPFTTEGMWSLLYFLCKIAVQLEDTLSASSILTSKLYVDSKMSRIRLGTPYTEREYLDSSKINTYNSPPEKAPFRHSKSTLSFQIGIILAECLLLESQLALILTPCTPIPSNLHQNTTQSIFKLSYYPFKLKLLVSGMISLRPENRFTYSEVFQLLQSYEVRIQGMSRFHTKKGEFQNIFKGKIDDLEPIINRAKKSYQLGLYENGLVNTQTKKQNLNGEAKDRLCFTPPRVESQQAVIFQTVEPFRVEHPALSSILNTPPFTFRTTTPQTFRTPLSNQFTNREPVSSSIQMNPPVFENSPANNFRNTPISTNIYPPTATIGNSYLLEPKRIIETHSKTPVQFKHPQYPPLPPTFSKMPKEEQLKPTQQPHESHTSFNLSLTHLSESGRSPRKNEDINNSYNFSKQGPESSRSNLEGNIDIFEDDSRQSSVAADFHGGSAPSQNDRNIKIEELEESELSEERDHVHLSQQSQTKEDNLLRQFEESSLIKPLNLDKKPVLKRQSTIINQVINLEIVGKEEEKEKEQSKLLEAQSMEKEEEQEQVGKNESKSQNNEDEGSELLIYSKTTKLNLESLSPSSRQPKQSSILLQSQKRSPFLELKLSSQLSKSPTLQEEKDSQSQSRKHIRHSSLQSEVVEYQSYLDDTSQVEEDDSALVSGSKLEYGNQSAIQKLKDLESPLTRPILEEKVLLPPILTSPHSSSIVYSHEYPKPLNNYSSKWQQILQPKFPYKKKEQYLKSLEECPKQLKSKLQDSTLQHNHSTRVNKSKEVIDSLYEKVKALQSNFPLEKTKETPL